MDCLFRRCYTPVVSTMKTCITIMFNSVIFQERAGVKMILIQDASQGPNVDKPLRIIGDPYKVQVHLWNHLIEFKRSVWCRVAMFYNNHVFLFSKPRRWCRRFWGRETMAALVKEMTLAPAWEEALMWVCVWGQDKASAVFKPNPNLPMLQMLSTQIPVPRHSVGVVIGRNGEMIKKIQNDAGVRIQFKQGRSLW